MKNTILILIAAIIMSSCSKQTLFNSEISTNESSGFIKGATNSTLSSPVIGDNLIRNYWDFEGNCNDYKGQKNPLSVNNISYPDTFCNASIGAYFNGVNAYATYTPGTTFNYGSIIFELITIIKTTDTTNCFIYGQGNSTGDASSRSHYLRMDSTGSVIVGFLSGGSLHEFSSGTTKINDGNKYSIVVQKDTPNNTVKMKINDVTINTWAWGSQSITNSTNKLSIGRLGDMNSKYFKGTIFGLGLMLKLTSSQETYYYNSGCFNKPQFN